MNIKNKIELLTILLISTVIPQQQILQFTYIPNFHICNGNRSGFNCNKFFSFKRACEEINNLLQQN